MDEKTVLFVDDERLVRQSIARVLKGENYRLLQAESGEAAMDIMKNNPVHVVLTDLSMPGTDGLALLRHIAESHPDTVRLILSGISDSDVLNLAMGEGNIYRYITKPWNDLELRILIRQALEYHSLNEDRRQLLDHLKEQNAVLEKKVEERTRQLTETMGAAMIGRHTAHIVHNLNNTLNNISGLFFLIGDELGCPQPDISDLKTHCKDGMLCVEKMHNIISDILNRSGKSDHLKLQAVDINAIIKEEERFFSMDSFYKYKITRRFDLDENLPKIKGNPIEIKQILDNLIKNAADAMETSPVKKLTFESLEDGGHVVVRLRDTGEGIENEAIRNIFDSGYTTKSPGKGTGLGLASVKSMVDSYGGEIRVFSKRGEGTCFEILLPL